MRHLWFCTQNSFFFWWTKVILTTVVSCQKNSILFCKSHFCRQKPSLSTTKGISVNKSVFCQDKILFFLQKLFLKAKVFVVNKSCFCQQRIQFCLTEFISVDKSHFCQKWFCDERIQFCTTKFIFVYKRDFCRDRIQFCLKKDVQKRNLCQQKWFLSGQNSILFHKLNFYRQK